MTPFTIYDIRFACRWVGEVDSGWETGRVGDRRSEVGVGLR